MYRITVVLFIVLFNVSVNCYIFNNIDFSAMQDRIFIDDDDVMANDFTAEDLIAMQRISLIYPGTKWCGAGNIAESYEDLGTKMDVDKCCREHDNCPEVMLAGETKYNLTNNAFYSRLHCDCDEKFRSCLHEVDSRTSSIIGKMYFNTIGTRCYRKDYPVLGCAKKGGWLHTKCVEYTYDRDGEPIYQWFDVPNY